MKKNMIVLIISALTLCLLVFGLIPSQLFFTNSNELYFNYSSLVMTLFPYFIISFIVFILAGFLFIKFNKKIFFFYLLILLSCIFIIWIDINFFEVKGNLDGKEHVDVLSIHSIINIIVAICVIILTYFLLKTRENYKNVIILLSIVLVSTGIAVFYSYSKFEHVDKELTSSIDQSKLFQLSENKNLIYIILDTFDAEFLRIILKEDDDNRYNNILKDFIFFNNYASAYGATRATGLAQFAGKIYKNEQPYEEFRRLNFSSGESFFEKLTAKGWKTTIYPDENVGLGVYAPNLDLYANTVNKKQNYKKAVNFLLDASIYKMVPLAFKNLVRSTQTSNKQGWDFAFLDVLNNDINIDMGGGNHFMLIHLMASHGPYIVNENMELDKNASPLTHSKASLKMVSMLFNKLKKANIYDNATIIIAADHGGQATRMNPILLIKDSKYTSDNITINNTAVYQTDIKNIVENYAFTDNFTADKIQNNTERFFYVHDGLQLLDREYFPPLTVYAIPNPVNSVKKIDDLEPIRFYPPKIENWDVSTHKIYDFKENDIPAYSLGNQWVRNEKGITGYKHIWMKLDSKYMHEFIARFYCANPKEYVNIVSRYDNDVISNGYEISDGYIDVYIRAKDFVNMVFQDKIDISKIEILPILDNTMALKYNIKKIDLHNYKLSIVNEGKGLLMLNLEQDYSNNKLIIKNANNSIPYFVVNRRLYIRTDDIVSKNNLIDLMFIFAKPLNSLKIKYGTLYRKYYPDEYVKPIGDDDFIENSKIIKSGYMPVSMFGKGWYENSSSYAWVFAHDLSELNLPLGKKFLNANKIKIQIKGFLYYDKDKTPQKLQVFIGEKLIADCIDKGDELFEFILNKEDISSNLKLTLKTSYEVSPKERGTSGDTRKFGFGLKHIKIDKLQ